VLFDGNLSWKKYSQPANSGIAGISAQPFVRELFDPPFGLFDSMAAQEMVRIIAAITPHIMMLLNLLNFIVLLT
jgi:hypothetical protein